MVRARSRENALGRLLDASARPLYAIDERRQIVYCNAACGELVGLDPAQLIGQRCDYQAVAAGTTPADIAASLCPPPAAFAGRTSRSIMSVLHVSGELHARCAEFVTLDGDELDRVGLIAVLHPSVLEGDCADVVEAETDLLHRTLAQLRRRYLVDVSFDEVVGVSLAIERVREQVALAARGKTHVVIQGPSGSGREHVARSLHRRAMPDLREALVPLWCPLLDAELVQTTVTALVRAFKLSSEERSGDAPGAPPGAPTLLLLEVDQLTAEAQLELAGFLGLPAFDLYTISTCQDSLIELAGQGRFRADLAHALSTLVIEIPPLAARPEDVPLLCQCLVERFNAQGGRQLSGFTSEALDELASYPWPENVDELAAVVQAACQASDGPWVDVRHLPEQIRWARQAAAHPRRDEPPIVLAQFLEEIEKELMVRAMKRAKGNKTKAARLLGVTRARFHRRLEHFGLST